MRLCLYMSLDSHMKEHLKSSLLFRSPLYLTLSKTLPDKNNTFSLFWNRSPSCWKRYKKTHRSWLLKGKKWPSLFTRWLVRKRSHWIRTDTRPRWIRTDTRLRQNWIFRKMEHWAFRYTTKIIHFKFRRSGVPTRASSSRRISKLCNLSRGDPD